MEKMKENKQMRDIQGVQGVVRNMNVTQILLLDITTIRLNDERKLAQYTHTRHWGWLKSDFRFRKRTNVNKLEIAREKLEKESEMNRRGTVVEGTYYLRTLSILDGSNPGSLIYFFFNTQKSPVAQFSILNQQQ